MHDWLLRVANVFGQIIQCFVQKIGRLFLYAHSRSLSLDFELYLHFFGEVRDPDFRHAVSPASSSR